MAERRRLLILGGTGDAADLAEALHGVGGWEVVTSLAGVTRNPRQVPGKLRVGGFGGVRGLSAYLENQAIDLVIDATHPFAARMSRNAFAACVQRRLPLLRLERAPWKKQAGDDWIEVSDAAAAAKALSALARRVFLTLGRQELAAFAELRDLWFLVRMIERPQQPLPLARSELVLARGPFVQADEEALMAKHRIGALVAKNSGGDATYGKIAAARALHIPVVMIQRPQLAPAQTVATVDDAVAWAESHC